jgi:diguanylate cyclase (GGDEF)-like protein
MEDSLITSDGNNEFEVLILDTREDESSRVEEILRDEGWSTRSLRFDSASVVPIIESSADIFIVDVETLSSGFQDSLRNHFIARNVPILLVSDKNQLEYARRILAGTPFDFVLRPFMDEELLARAHSCIEYSGVRKFLQIKNDELHSEIENRARIENELNLSEDRLDALLSLSEQKSQSEQELNSFVLDECVRLTGSTMGYLHYINEAEDGFLSYVWSKGAAEACVAKEETMDFSLTTAGIWADSMRRRGPVVHNDYATIPGKKGLPVGHIPILRIMTIPIMKGEKMVAVLGVANKPTYYNEADQRQLMLFGNRLWSIIEGKRNDFALAKANAELHYLATTDSLTGLANRHSLNNFLALRWGKCSSMGESVAAMMIDIDFFKSYNDTYGHQAGDDVLKKIGAVILNERKKQDSIAARFGGDEFLIVSCHTDVEEMKRLAFTFIDKVRGLEIPHSQSSVCPFVTISIGMAKIVPTHGSSPDHLIRLADEALYAAKRLGRNRVEEALSHELESPGF